MPSVSSKPTEKRDLVSIDEFLTMDCEEKVELVEGRIVKTSRTNFVHASLVGWLCEILGGWSRDKKWGIVSGGDTGVLTKANPDSARGADVAAISFDRYSKVNRKGKILDVGPELVIEVISPSNSWTEIHTKIKEYLAIGTDEVWVISPEHFSVTIYKSDRKIEAFEADKHDFVSGLILPDFKLPLGEMKDLIQLIEGKDLEAESE